MKKLTYNWNLKNAKFTGKSGTVFSTFACGGGSSMGYKLAGYKVVGCNEVDPKMMMIYLKNNRDVKYAYNEPIQHMKLRRDLPDELYKLDILDGSPPCSSFTYSGLRGKAWGEEKTFKEGKYKQRLDRLVFDFIDLAEMLQPKIVIAENVVGIIEGGAKKYVVEMYERFLKAGYVLQHFVLDGSKMGVPQRRERVFFIAMRKDLVGPFLRQLDMFTSVPELVLDFNDRPVCYGEIMTDSGRELTVAQRELWNVRKKGDVSLSDINERIRGVKSDFNSRFMYVDQVLSTITSEGTLIDFDRPTRISDEAIIKASTFPSDYDFMGFRAQPICGLAVPPLMIAKISREIYKQWLSKLNN